MAKKRSPRRPPEYVQTGNGYTRATQRKGPSIFVTSREARRISSDSARYTGFKSRIGGASLMAMAAGTPGKSKFRAGVFAAGAGLYAYGKYKQIKHGRAVHKGLKSGKLEVSRAYTNKKGKAFILNQRLQVNDRAAAKQRLAGMKGPKMSRSQAARAAALARWGRR